MLRSKSSWDNRYGQLADFFPLNFNESLFEPAMALKPHLKLQKSGHCMSHTKNKTIQMLQTSWHCFCSFIDKWWCSFKWLLYTVLPFLLFITLLLICWIFKKMGSEKGNTWKRWKNTQNWNENRCLIVNLPCRIVPLRVLLGQVLEFPPPRFSIQPKVFLFSTPWFFIPP